MICVNVKNKNRDEDSKFFVNPDYVLFVLRFNEGVEPQGCCIVLSNGDRLHVEEDQEDVVNQFDACRMTSPAKFS